MTADAGHGVGRTEIYVSSRTIDGASLGMLAYFTKS
jgi:hypothetical protein